MSIIHFTNIFNITPSHICYLSIICYFRPKLIPRYLLIMFFPDRVVVVSMDSDLVWIMSFSFDTREGMKRGKFRIAVGVCCQVSQWHIFSPHQMCIINLYKCEKWWQVRVYFARRSKDNCMHYSRVGAALTHARTQLHLFSIGLQRKRKLCKWRERDEMETCANLNAKQLWNVNLVEKNLVHLCSCNCGAGNKHSRIVIKWHKERCASPERT